MTPNLSVWLRLTAVTVFAAVSISAGSAQAAGPNEAAPAAGTVALVSGRAWIRHGEITLTGKPGVQYTDAYTRELGPNDPIAPGDVVLTSNDSYLKIYYRDDSIMDVGPNSTLKVLQFQTSPTARHIWFSILEGKVRTLVTRSLDNGSSYRVATPISSMSVHGTEWVTNSYRQESQFRTDVTVLEGKVVIDVPRAGQGGRPGVSESVAVTPGRSYSSIGANGLVNKYNVVKLSAPQIEEMVALISTIETKKGAAATVTASRLPGTGLSGAAPPGPTEEPDLDRSNVRGLATTRGAAAVNAGGAITAFMPRGPSLIGRPGMGGGGASPGATPASPGPAAGSIGGGVSSSAATAITRPLPAMSAPSQGSK